VGNCAFWEQTNSPQESVALSEKTLRFPRTTFTPPRRRSAARWSLHSKVLFSTIRLPPPVSVSLSFFSVNLAREALPRVSVALHLRQKSIHCRWKCALLSYNLFFIASPLFVHCDGCTRKLVPPCGIFKQGHLRKGEIFEETGLLFCLSWIDPPPVSFARYFLNPLTRGGLEPLYFSSRYAHLRFVLVDDKTTHTCLRSPHTCRLSHDSAEERAAFWRDRAHSFCLIFRPVKTPGMKPPFILSGALPGVTAFGKEGLHQALEVLHKSKCFSQRVCRLGDLGYLRFIGLLIQGLCSNPVREIQILVGVPCALDRLPIIVPILNRYHGRVAPPELVRLTETDMAPRLRSRFVTNQPPRGEACSLCTYGSRPGTFGKCLHIFPSPCPVYPGALVICSTGPTGGFPQL